MIFLFCWFWCNYWKIALVKTIKKHNFRHVVLKYNLIVFHNIYDPVFQWKVFNVFHWSKNFKEHEFNCIANNSKNTYDYLFKKIEIRINKKNKRRNVPRYYILHENCSYRFMVNSLLNMIDNNSGKYHGKTVIIVNAVLIRKRWM